MMHLRIALAHASAHASVMLISPTNGSQILKRGHKGTDGIPNPKLSASTAATYRSVQRGVSFHVPPSIIL
jgi:hypothetical protein